MQIELGEKYFFFVIVVLETSHQVFEHT
jgi:hypothetical protein